MADLTAIEQEIIEATGFKMKRFAKRQDYLGAIARAMEKMPNDDYDNLSDEATDWYEKAAEAVNSNDDIPDFPEEDEVEGDDAADDTADDDADDEDTSDDDEADDETDEGDEDADDEREESADDEEGSDEEAEPEPEPEPKKPVKGKGKKEPEPEPKPEPEPEPARGPKGTTPEIVAKMKAKKDAAEAKHARKQGSKRNLPKTRYDDLTGEKNRYGFVKGTKVDDFIKMIEKGASMAEVRAALEDTYYNTIKKLREDGHSVEKNDAGKFVLKHKDDVTAKKPKGKKE